MPERNPITELVSASLLFMQQHGTLRSPDLSTELLLRLLRAMRKEGLLAWDRETKKYYLTALAHEWLRVYDQDGLAAAS